MAAGVVYLDTPTYEHGRWWVSILTNDGDGDRTAAVVETSRGLALEVL